MISAHEGDPGQCVCTLQVHEIESSEDRTAWKEFCSPSGKSFRNSRNQEVTLPKTLKEMVPYIHELLRSRVYLREGRGSTENNIRIQWK